MGQEVVRTLTIKNVCPRALRLQCEAPDASAGFRAGPLACAQPVNTGMSATVTVTFTPQHKQLHEAPLVFVSGDGARFTVQLRGLPARAMLQLPESLDFGLCALATPTTRTFKLTNTSPKVHEEKKRRKNMGMMF